MDCPERRFFYMKRFVLVLKILVLVLLVVLIPVGCSWTSETVSVSKAEVMVGEQVELSVEIEKGGSFGCDNPKPKKMAGYLYDWSLKPSDGATVNHGVFVASKPGEYTVTPVIGTTTRTVTPRTILVLGTETENSAADNIAPEANKIVTESDDTSTETKETIKEADANLHGLVPTKIKVHTHQATDDKDSYSDHYIEFWNIGELGGEQYAKATDHYVATRDGAQFSEITFEGTFTGGPNGLIEMSAVSSSGNDEGSTAKMVLQLIDGKQLQNPSNGYILQIVNPEALVGAFDGWKD
jgi:hypothetical protein